MRLRGSICQPVPPAELPIASSRGACQPSSPPISGPVCQALYVDETHDDQRRREDALASARGSQTAKTPHRACRRFAGTRGTDRSGRGLISESCRWERSLRGRRDHLHPCRLHAMLIVWRTAWRVSLIPISIWSTHLTSRRPRAPAHGARSMLLALMLCAICPVPTWSTPPFQHDACRWTPWKALLHGPCKCLLYCVSENRWLQCLS